jgi:hypothetical protein
MANNIRPPEQAIAAARSSMKTLKILCQSYDDGNFDIEREIATVIFRLLVEELPQTKLRRKLKFISYTAPPNPKNLLMQLLASGVQGRVQSDGADPTITITHVPLRDQHAEWVGQPTAMKFNEWWNGFVQIAGASAGPVIPINQNEQIPYNKRTKISRLNLIQIIRNKYGAHYSREIDEDTMTIEDRLIRAIDISVNVSGKEFNHIKNPEAFIFSNTRSGAIVRHIAFEIDASQHSWPF